MNTERLVDCTILVSATENRGIFGNKVISRETFRMSARSAAEAQQCGCD